MSSKIFTQYNSWFVYVYVYRYSGAQEDVDAMKKALKDCTDGIIHDVHYKDCFTEAVIDKNDVEIDSTITRFLVKIKNEVISMGDPEVCRRILICMHVYICVFLMLRLLIV